MLDASQLEALNTRRYFWSELSTFCTASAVLPSFASCLSVYWTISEMRRFEGSSGFSGLQELVRETPDLRYLRCSEAALLHQPAGEVGAIN